VEVGKTRKKKKGGRSRKEEKGGTPPNKINSRGYVKGRRFASGERRDRTLQTHKKE